MKLACWIRISTPQIRINEEKLKTELKMKKQIRIPYQRIRISQWRLKSELKLKKQIQIPYKWIRITQCILQSKAKKNFTDSNPIKLDSNPKLGNQNFMCKGFESLKYRFESPRQKIKSDIFPTASFWGLTGLILF